MTVDDPVSARAILTTPSGSILLMRIGGASGDLWITPGGRIRPGESARAALVRELAEETGLTDASVGPEVWVRHGTCHEGGHRHVERERFFRVTVHRSFTPAIDAMETDERTRFREFRWWSPDDVRTSTERFVPRDLGERLVALMNSGPPATPIVIDERDVFAGTPGATGPSPAADAPRDVVFETERLIVRRAGPRDADVLHRLWTTPEVMVHVGFPRGLPITRGEVLARLRTPPESAFGALLIVSLRSSGVAIGECAMRLPDANGVSTTDVKLLPEFWGHRYGVEVKRALVDTLFRETDCECVEATPNVANVASIRMQEAVGGVRVGEATGEFPEEMRAYTVPVHHYVYRVRRSTWAGGRSSRGPHTP